MLISRLMPWRSQPHYVADHCKQAAALIRRHGAKDGIQKAVGGNFESVGAAEAAILKMFGLKDHDRIVDVGCGSGRLAAALSDMTLHYHGIDVVPAFIKFARTISPAHFRFTRVRGLHIPEQDGTADFVCFFSVATHLAHHETFAYLKEACRVLKPGGRLIMSFLHFSNPDHWSPFENSVAAIDRNPKPPINTMIEPDVIAMWGAKLGLTLDQTILGHEKAVMVDGSLVAFGQSVAALSKPDAA